VIIDEDLRIVQFLGHTGRFLEPMPGDASLTLLKMVRDGLLHGVRTALHEARRQGQPARRGGLRMRGDEVEVTVEVVPLGAAAAPGRHFAVLFLEAEPAEPPPHRRGKGKRRGASADPRVSKLDQELTATRDYLQSIIQELEAANEELQSANEEILSSNEELQSANEELDTAKEELESTNEELNTVNEELKGRNEELSRANSDLLNLLANVQVALVIVDNRLNIQRLTPMAERVLNLIPSDVGRPISHIQPNIECPDLEQQIHEVIDKIQPYEREVQDRQGRWFSLQIRPYKSVDNRIDGAVLTLYDVDLVKREAGIRSARDYLDAIIQTMREGLVVLDANLRVETVNKAFSDMFGVSAGDMTGRPLYETNGGEWNIPQLRSLLEEILPEDKTIERFDVEHDFRSLGRRVMRLNARRLQNRAGMPGLILLAIEDVTDHGK
jgi:two-component system CheB/CheR fusion protein